MLSQEEGGVGYVIFNNPERHNAVSLDMWAATAASWRTSNDDKDVRVVVADRRGRQGLRVRRRHLEVRGRRSRTRRRSRATTRRSKASYTALHEFPEADHRDDPRLLHRRRRSGSRCAATCASRPRSSTFGVPAAKLGLGYGYPGLKRLVDMVGPAFAKEIFYTARQFDRRAEARAMGLVNRVVPDAELENYVRNYAETIAGNAPLTIKAVKFIGRPKSR